MLFGELNLDLSACVTLFIADKHVGRSNIVRLDAFNLKSGLVTVEGVMSGVDIARYVRPKHPAGR